MTSLSSNTGGQQRSAGHWQEGWLPGSPPQRLLFKLHPRGCSPAALQEVSLSWGRGLKSRIPHPTPESGPQAPGWGKASSSEPRGQQGSSSLRLALGDAPAQPNPPGCTLAVGFPKMGRTPGLQGWGCSWSWGGAQPGVGPRP